MLEVLLCTGYPRGHGCASDNRLGAAYSAPWDDILQGNSTRQNMSKSLYFAQSLGPASVRTLFT